MGFWVTSQNIQRLIAKLDWKFSDARIGSIRSKPKRLARFDPNNNRNLRNIARLMRIWPGGPNESNSTDATKWYGFLAWLHTQTNASTGNATIVADDIRAAIFGGLNDPNCRAISFVAIEGTDVRINSTPIQLPQQPGNVLVIVLQTVGHGNDPKPDPGPTDGNDSEDPSSEDLAVAIPRLKARQAKKKSKSKKATPKKKKASRKRTAKK